MVGLRSIALSLGIACIFALGACSDNVNESLGFGRSTPDEFSVVERPPLTLPPDFDLRPPQPGAPRPNEKTASESVRGAILSGRAMGESDDYGNTSGNNKNKSASSIESSLLGLTKANDADPNIRTIIDREEAKNATASRHLIQDIMFWRDAPLPPATTLDASAEAERLRAAKQQGSAPSSSATPVIEKGKKGWLE